MDCLRIQRPPAGREDNRSGLTYWYLTKTLDRPHTAGTLETTRAPLLGSVARRISPVAPRADPRRESPDA